MSNPQYPQGQPQWGQPQQPQYGQPQQAPQFGQPQPQQAPQAPQYGQPQQPQYGQPQQTAYGQTPYDAYGQPAYAPAPSAPKDKLWVILSLSASGLALLLLIIFNIVVASAFSGLNSLDADFESIVSTVNTMSLLRNILVPLLGIAGAVFGFLASKAGSKFLGGIGLGFGGGVALFALINLIGGVTLA